MCLAARRSSATMRIRSPTSASIAVARADCSSSVRNLATGELRPSSVTFIHTRPFAPHDRHWSVISSSRLRDVSAPPGTRMPFTHGAWNARNSVAANTSVNSTSSILNRMSGLSVPNRSMASSHDIRGISPRRSPVIASAADATVCEMNASTSSWETKLASASSCMNSNWRSALRSSSRRQRAIW